MNYRFRSKDSPDANGRQPLHGESSWLITIPLDDAGTLELRIGQKGCDAIREMLHQESTDNLAELKETKAMLSKAERARDLWIERSGQWQENCNAALAELERKNRALRPFAALGKKMLSSQEGPIIHIHDVEICVGHLKFAAEVMNKLG